MRPWLKLLLLVLVTLVLPWDGVRYARQMEAALRQSERQDLQSLARTLAASLQGRMRLIYRYPALGTQPGPYDLTPVVLPAPLYVDGYADGWPAESRLWRRYGRGAHHFDILSGVNGRMLYVLLRVTDPHLVFDAPSTNPLRPRSIGDRIWIGFAGPRGADHAEFLALTGAGPVVAHRIVRGEYGRRRALADPRIVGALQPHPGGYDVEMSIPLSMLGGPFGVLIDDCSGRGGPPIRYGMLHRRTLRPRGGLILASAALADYLRRLLRPGLRLSVTTPAGALLAQADRPAVPGIPAPQPGLLARLFRRLVGPDGERRIAAAAPIQGLRRRGVIARLEITQTPNRWAQLRDRTLERMLNLTLATSALAFIVAVILAAQMATRAWRRHGARHATQPGADEKRS